MNISKLSPGDNHPMAYVGPPQQYDFMGATQFRLLSTLGLRADHYLLDFGCGSLRAGRLFISYLNKDRYFGIEPNKWLIEDAIKNQLGEDLIEIKRPQFDHNSDFKVDCFSKSFDFIVAQSIFSHTGSELITTALTNFREVLKPDGLIVATFVEGVRNFEGNGWIYPGVVRYRPSQIKWFAKEAGYFAIHIPWYHPRQTWYLLAKEKNRLPNKFMLRHLTGAVLFDEELKESCKYKQRNIKLLKSHLQQSVPKPIKKIVKNIINKT